MHSIHAYFSSPNQLYASIACFSQVHAPLLPPIKPSMAGNHLPAVGFAHQSSFKWLPSDFVMLAKCCVGCVFLWHHTCLHQVPPAIALSWPYQCGMAGDCGLRNIVGMLCMGLCAPLPVALTQACLLATPDASCAATGGIWLQLYAFPPLSHSDAS